MIRHLKLDDARIYASLGGEQTGSPVVFISDCRQLDLTNSAFQPGFLFYGYCQQGEAVISMNSQEHALHAGDLLVGMSSPVVENRTMSDDFDGQLILVSYDFLRDSLAGLHQFWPYLRFVYEQPVLHLDPEERSLMRGNYLLAQQRLGAPRHRYSREAITAVIRLFYFDTCGLLDRRCAKDESRGSRNYSIFDQFIHLAGENFKRERAIQWYAQQLCISPKYLSETVKAVSGQTAGQWVSNFTLMEIKMLLRNTGLSIKEIASEMNFPNQSVLGKYFKHLTGLSPLAYRAR